MDELAQYNRERWNALAQARVEYSRPFLQMDAVAARAWYNERMDFVVGNEPDPAGKDVLCLAGGGGQQTAAFGLLGARVTVLDLSDTQLERDREAAAHFGYTLAAVQGDMRNLAPFATNSFDIVWHPYSINFVNDPMPVFAEVARVIRPGGLYHLQFSNPFWTMEESDWTEKGYPLRQPYVTGQKLQYSDDAWTFEDEAGNLQRVQGPHEFLHTMSHMLNGLIRHGFVLAGFHEGPPGDATAAPGTWEHLLSVIPPFWTAVSYYRPNLLNVL